VRDRVDAARSHAIDAGGIHVIACGEPLYPELVRLRLGAHAPPFLFARGALELLSAPGIAVVGSRNATEYGLDMAEQLGGGIARAGGCVVSGLALGIDAAAHAAALDAGGATIAVLGCGSTCTTRPPIAHSSSASHAMACCSPNCCRPSARAGTTIRIATASSPHCRTPSSWSKRGNAAAPSRRAITPPPRACPCTACRTRYICENAQGIMALFRDGANVYTGLRDFLEVTGLIALGDDVPGDLFRDAPPDDAVHARLWRALAEGPVHADALAHAAGLAPTEALVALLELELDGRVRQLAGQRFERWRDRRRN
jgi:DNA processing protein